MNGIVNGLRVTGTQTEAARGERVGTQTQTARFADVMSVQFSKHANMRLNARNINLTGEQIRRVENGIVQAKEKGIRDSLVLVDDVALVVNVRSRTVITAIQNASESSGADTRSNEKGHVFSNIDGAVIV